MPTFFNPSSRRGKDAEMGAFSYRLIAGGQARSSASARDAASARNEDLSPSDRTREAENAVILDGVLMRAVATGDGEAFSRLIRAEAPRLTRFVAAMLSSVAEAEEVVQESLIRLWKEAPTWQPQARIGTFLHHVAYRLAVDRLRRRRPQVDIDTMEDQLEDMDQTAEMGLVRADDVRRVHEALDRLPERQRAAILLAHFQDMGQSEAAAAMGLSEHAYESLLARGRRRLRVLLSGPTDEGREEWIGS